MNISFSRIRDHIRARVMGFQYAKQTVLAFIAAWVLVFGGNVPTFAQTMVPLEFDGAVNAMFSSANSWMTTLAPVLSIGFGILIALAVLGLVGYLIVSALQSARKGMGK